MMDERGTLERLAGQLAIVLSPLSGLGTGAAQQLLAELGLPVTPEQLAALAPSLQATTAAFGDLADLLQGVDAAVQSGAPDQIVTQALAAGRQAGALLSGLDQLKAGLAALGLPDAGPILADLQQRITGLLVSQVVTRPDGIAPLLELLGVLVRTDFNVLPVDPDKPFYTVHEFHLDQLAGWIKNPAGQLAALYDWGSPGFDGRKLLAVVDRLAGGGGLPSFYDPAADPPMVDLVLASLAAPATLSPRGLAVHLPGGLVPTTVQLAQNRWSLTLALDAAVSSDTTIVLQPGKITLQPPVSATASVTYQYLRDPSEPLLLLSFPGGSRISVEEIDASATLQAAPDGTVTVSTALKLLRGAVLIDTGGADGFIAKILGTVPLQASFGIGASVSLAQGVHFDGSGALQIQVATHVGLGPLDISSLTLVIEPAADALAVELAADLKFKLGPLGGVVQGVGTRIPFRLVTDNTGNLGPLDVQPGFRPPTGVGLTVDAGMVTGGGFLSFDPAAGEYAGVLELEFAGFLELKAIGLITTRLPDGSEGFSLLLVLTAEFPGGLQLGYGFTLLGVGGVIGLNRGMRLEAIMEGVRTGAVESVMFPRDVVANAPRVLSDLKAFFPPQEGIFLIGPMAKLGWGTPTLASASLAVIIEIPGNVAIIGVLKVALPTEDEVLLLLQVNFAGVIEFDKKRLYFFASLYQSRILTITIEGELGLLVAYGDRPDFVLSVGGFHPAFKPPPLPFPVPRRISINILNNGVERISVDGYFAVTSNTAQFGAHAELFFGFSALSISGHIGFDVLFQFSPFRFVIDISAGVSVRAFGVGVFSVSLDLTLSGPAPWEAKGTASISLLFFSIPVDFDVTWGEQRDTTLPPVSVLPLLAAELSKPESWRTRPPAGGSPLVTVRGLAETEAGVVLHPLGTLLVQQRAVPLDIRVDKVGSERAADVSQCQVAVNGEGLVKVSDAADMFALAQFQNLSDAQKLSLPSFEPEHAGLELAPDGAALASYRAVRRSARYEQIVISPAVPAPPRHFVPYNSTLFRHFLGGASVTRSPLAQAQRTLRQPFTDLIAVPGEAYVVASSRDNTAAGPVFSSHAQARVHLESLLATDPARVGKLHVIPAVEVAT
jgi:hypothetical protein